MEKQVKKYAKKFVVRGKATEGWCGCCKCPTAELFVEVRAGFGEAYFDNEGRLVLALLVEVDPCSPTEEVWEVENVAEEGKDGDTQDEK